MISIEDKTLNKIKTWSTDSVYVLTDFDRTLTSYKSQTSWNILSHSNIMCDEYCAERNALYDYYRPIELDSTIDYETKNKLMIEWWNKHIGLFVKYKLSESTVASACKDANVMTFRKGAKQFLKKMSELNIPVIIISAGIGNFIKDFLTLNNCYFDNIYILSNFIQFSNGIATGISDNMIHSLNKNEISLPHKIADTIKNKSNIILFGDSISDVLMAKEDTRANALKIGFLDENIKENMNYFKEAFDIVATNNTSFDSICKLLPFFNY